MALGKKPSCFVYFIGDEGGILIHIEKGVVARRLFAPTAADQHTSAFTDLLHEHPKLPVYALIDVIDQSYVRHSMPPVTALGVKRLVQRRISRDFPAENINGALPLGREKTGRKEWLFLLISLATNGDLSQWIDHISSIENRFNSIHLVPVECEIFLTSLHQKHLLATEGKPAKTKRGKKGDSEQDTWLILVSHNKTGGVRQVVLKNGQLIFTRLTQSTEDASPEVLAGSIEQEIANTLEYLKRLSYNEHDKLAVYGILSPESKEMVSPKLEGGNSSFKIFSPFEVAQLFNLEQAVLSGDKFGDVVLGTAFAMANKKRLSLASPALEKLNSMYSKLAMIKWGGIALTLGMVGLLAMTYMSWNEATSGVREEEKKLRILQSEFEQLNEKTQRLPDDVDDIAGLITLADKLESRKDSAFEELDKLQGLIRDDQLIRSIDWSKGQDLSVNEAEKLHEISFIVEFRAIEPSWELFLVKTQEFETEVKTIFPNYDFAMEDIVRPDGKDENAATSINFEDELGSSLDDQNTFANALITTTVTLKQKKGVQ